MHRNLSNGKFDAEQIIGYTQDKCFIFGLCEAINVEKALSYFDIDVSFIYSYTHTIGNYKVNVAIVVCQSSWDGCASGENGGCPPARSRSVRDECGTFIESFKV